MDDNNNSDALSEDMHDRLRSNEERQKRIDRLNALIDEGEASGYVEDFDFDAFIAEIGDDEENDPGENKAA